MPEQQRQHDPLDVPLEVLTPIEIRVQLARIRSEMGLMRTEQGEIKATLREVRDRVWSTPTCPSPGLCVMLQQQGNDRESRLRSLERRDAVVVGACGAISFVMPFIIHYLFKL
jgi:hypothetical protein